MAPSRPIAWFREAPWWLRGLLLGTPIYVLWLASYPAATPWHRFFEVGFLTLLQASVVGLLWQASRRADGPEGFRQACRWLALAWSMSVLASLAFPFTQVYQNEVANLGLVDIFYLAGYPLTYFGLTRLPKAGPPLPGVGRVLLDSAAFIAGVGVPMWVFAVHPALVKTLDLSSFLSAAYPIMALLGVMVLNYVLLRSAPFPSPVALNLILAGLGISWLADMMFAMVITQTAVTGLRYWVNISNALALLLALLGSWRAVVDPAPAHPLRPATVSPIPMLTIVFVSLGLAHLMLSGSMDSGTVFKVVAGGMPLLVVLLLRETLALRETTRQAAELATAHHQARFEALVRHSSDLVLVLDDQGDIHFASPAAAKVLGRSAETMEGRTLESFVHPEDQATTADFITNLLQAPGALIHLCRMEHADGSWRVLECSGSNLRKDPAVHGLVLNARDITERYRLEDRLREAQKMEAVGRLAGGVAHDFNNLLSAILGNVELAGISLPEGHAATKDLKRIHGAATRGAALTSRLLAFCRKEVPESRTVDPGEILRGVVPLLEGLLGERIRLLLDIEPGVWPIAIDPNALEQAVLNLAANARDAMPEGGQLTLSLQNTLLPEPLLTPFLPIAAGEAVSLEITDSGTGMDDATLHHLFEPFFTTKSRGRGTGLGLASVYGLVQASHGGIDVRSRIGQGTTFRLVFPRSLEVPEKAELAAASLSVHGSETILLVEDEPAVRETTQRILTGCGYSVLVAEHAQAARAIFQENGEKVDLLLTDVIMPGESGPALAKDLVWSHPWLRVLYISGYTANELGPQGLARPDAPILMKPFTASQLTRRIRAILAGPPGQI